MLGQHTFNRTDFTRVCLVYRGHLTDDVIITSLMNSADVKKNSCETTSEAKSFYFSENIPVTDQLQTLPQSSDVVFNRCRSLFTSTDSFI